LRDLITAHARPGAPLVSDRALASSASVSLLAARAIAAQNSTIFARVASVGSYRLSESYDPAAALVIPADIPIRAETITAMLVPFTAPVVIAPLLAVRLGVSPEKARALAALVGRDFDAAATRRALARVLHGSDSSSTLRRSRTSRPTDAITPRRLSPICARRRSFVRL
jgi:hypothetical protein